MIDVSVEQARSLPLPWPDASVAALRLAGVFHRLAAPERIRFMEEAWRVLRPGGTLEVTAPHARSDAASAPDAAWPPLVESSFLYFDAEARRDMGVPHYGIRCDFELEVGLELAPEWQARSAAEQQHAAKHLHGAIASMTAFLTRRAAS
jgi:hypothetical protein